MKIAFYTPCLSERGTETALYDYAFYNEKILGNESIIIYCDTDTRNNETAVKKFKNQFRVFSLKGPNFNYGWLKEYVFPQLDNLLVQEKCDVLYMQKGGKNDGIVSKVCKTVILCASPINDPHGDRYAYVSCWLSKSATNHKLPWVPIIIDLPSTNENLRNSLNIPQDGIVFGRTGGYDTWNIPWVNEAIYKALNLNSNLYFIFQNTPPLPFKHSNIKYVETTADLYFKAKFINTCDAMLHARADGESFGQTIAEFSIRNKPIITHGRPESSWNHIETLKEKGIYYFNTDELVFILNNFTKKPELDWNCFKDHTPMHGILKFKEILLDGLFEDNSRKNGILIGSFDVLHLGYIKAFKECKKNCKNLTIYLHADPSLERPNKIRPIHSIEERKEMLLSTRYVDDIIVYDTEAELYNLLKTNLKNIDVRFLGDDYFNKDFTGKDLNIPLHFIKRDHGWSTTRYKKLIYEQQTER